MKIVTEILIFLFVGLLDLIRADIFPHGFPENFIRVKITEETITLQASIEDRRNYSPQRMIWMYLHNRRPRTPEGYMAHIELPGNRHYGSKGVLQKSQDDYFGIRLRVPEQAFLRFEGSGRFEAKNFVGYEPRRSTDRHLEVGRWGRLYIAYPQTCFFTALLEPAFYNPTPPRYISPPRSLTPPRSPLPTTSLTPLGSAFSTSSLTPPESAFSTSSLTPPVSPSSSTSLTQPWSLKQPRYHLPNTFFTPPRSPVSTTSHTPPRSPLSSASLTPSRSSLPASSPSPPKQRGCCSFLPGGRR